MDSGKKSGLKAPLVKRLHSMDEAAYFGPSSQDAEDTNNQKDLQKRIEDNWKSGLTVALVNLPLCIALAVASGSTPSAGILSGIVGGVISGLYGGSNYNIIGPTGALSGFLSAVVFRYGIHSLPYFALITGVLTLVIRNYGLAKYIDLFPVAVNEGFTVGVAVIILVNQLNPALGIGKFKTENFILTNATNVEIIQTEVTTHSEDSLIHNLMNQLKHIDQMNPTAFLVFAACLGGLYYFIKTKPTIPWQAVAAIVGILLGASGLKVETLYTKFGNVKLNIYDFSYIKNSPTTMLNPAAWTDALPITFIAVLETLISAKIADAMTRSTFHKSNELRGLGYANILCGILGGVPITAALARTTLNIKSGATDKISSVINGVILFFIALVCMPLFKFLPMCVAAAQVSIVAIRMVNFEEIEHLYHKDKPNFFILLTTAVICILTDPTVGIIAGMLIFLMHFSQNIITPWTEIITTSESKVKNTDKFAPNESMYFTEEKRNQGVISQENYLVENLNMFISDLPKGEGEYVLYRIIGILNFMNVKEHLDKLKKLIMTENNITIVISFRYLKYIDLDAMHAIKHLLDSVASERGSSTKQVNNKIVIMGLSKNNLEMFSDNKDWIMDLHKNNMLVFKDPAHGAYFES